MFIHGSTLGGQGSNMPDAGVSTGGPEEGEVQSLLSDFVVHREEDGSVTTQGLCWDKQPRGGG